MPKPILFRHEGPLIVFRDIWAGRIAYRDPPVHGEQLVEIESYAEARTHAAQLGYKGISVVFETLTQGVSDV